MKTMDDARVLAHAMIKIGKIAGKPVICVLTPMHQPLGRSIGNILEMQEAWNIIQGHGPRDAVEICVTIAACMLYLAESSQKIFNLKDYRGRIMDVLNSLRPVECFRTFVQSQGGVLDSDGNPIYTSEPKNIGCFCAETSGYIESIDALLIGEASMILGAGRKNQEDQIDPAAGITLSVKIGDYADKDQILAEFFCGTEVNMSQDKYLQAYEKCKSAFSLSKLPISPLSDEIEIINDL